MLLSDMCMRINSLNLSTVSILSSLSGYLFIIIQSTYFKATDFKAVKQQSVYKQMRWCH